MGSRLVSGEDKGESMKKFEAEAYGGAIQVNVLIVNMGDKGMAKITFESRDLAWEFYCKNFKLELTEIPNEQ